MERTDFLKAIFSASIVSTLSGFETLCHAMSKTETTPNNSMEIASFGAVHLNNTSLKRSAFFWTTIVGLKPRKSFGKTAAFGTETKTLVVVHETAKTPYKKGYSGLYHFAIHAPNKNAFACMLKRLIDKNYPFSPVDHTMSKSIYLEDPDGITIEFTLETPERFKRIVTTNGLKIEDAKGTLRNASDYLDTNLILKDLDNQDTPNSISKNSYIGHLHLYAEDVDRSNVFYKELGFSSFNYLPQFMYADLGAGGSYKHRMALNSWHGKNRPLAPKDAAGMAHFQINFNSIQKLNQAVTKLPDSMKSLDGYWCYDPTGNKIQLSSE